MDAVSIQEEFVRPLNRQEALSEKGNKAGVVIIGFQLILNSKKPLQVDHVETALKLLFRKVPNLQLRIKDGEEGLAFYRIGAETICFKCHGKEVDPSALTQKNVTTPFDSKVGPLWRCDLVLQQNEEAAVSEGYSNTVIFTFHHAISDGFSSLTMCGIFFKLLNDVIGEKPIDDKPLVRMVEGDLYEKLIERRQKEVENSPQLLDEIEEKVLKKDAVEVLISKLCQASQENKTVKHITRDLCEGKMKSLLSIFKNEKVTFHSGFCSIVELAQISLIKELCKVDPNRKFLRVNCKHLIDLRRYADKENKEDIGAFIGLIDLITETPLDLGLDDMDNFWNFARAYHSELYTNIRECKAFDEIILGRIRPAMRDTTSKYPTKRDEPMTYYTANNLGDVTDLLGGSEEHVKVSWLTAYNHVFNPAMSHFFQTLRGRLLYRLNYRSHFLTDDLANMVVDKIFGIVDSLVEKCVK